MPTRKGIPNKYGKQVKENIIAVFTRLGGTDRMAQWAEDNLTEFYRHYARLAPTEITTDQDGPISVYVLAGDLQAYAQAARGQLVAEQPGAAHPAVRRLPQRQNILDMQGAGLASDYGSSVTPLRPEIQIGACEGVHNDGYLPKDDEAMLSEG